MKISLLRILDEKACYELLREARWSEGVNCAHCSSTQTTKQGLCTNGLVQKYACSGCGRDFNDLTNTIFSNSKKSLKVWIACLYLMSLNVSNNQISKELEISQKSADRMTRTLREGIAKKSLIFSLLEQLKSTKYM